MLSEFCDACKMTIATNDDAVHVRWRHNNFDLCGVCGEGVIAHLTQLRVLSLPKVIR